MKQACPSLSEQLSKRAKVDGHQPSAEIQQSIPQIPNPLAKVAPQNPHRSFAPPTGTVVSKTVYSTSRRFKTTHDSLFREIEHLLQLHPELERQIPKEATLSVSFSISVPLRPDQPIQSVQALANDKNQRSIGSNLEVFVCSSEEPNLVDHNHQSDLSEIPDSQPDLSEPLRPSGVATVIEILQSAAKALDSIRPSIFPDDNQSEPSVQSLGDTDDGDDDSEEPEEPMVALQAVGEQILDDDTIQWYRDRYHSNHAQLACYECGLVPTHYCVRRCFVCLERRGCARCGTHATLPTWRTDLRAWHALHDDNAPKPLDVVCQRCYRYRYH